MRSDGVVGDLVLSEPSDVLYPGIAFFFLVKPTVEDNVE